ncbi:MAG TPA: MerR family transcriptional regulator [Pseudonocardiaceae bacterium]|nr:MerR family transcriptional regulator [Pseudonocardiaceae bacterium]
MTAPGRRPGDRTGASIGSVLDQLRAEFPDITISKIRFLESEGLVRPERTAAGYRQFSETDVERLRYVLAAQRDHYLPLRVIKENLDARDRGEPRQAAQRWGQQPLSVCPDAGTGPGDAGRGGDGPGGDAVARMTQEELLAAAGISQASLHQLEQFGLLRPGPAGFYDPDAVLVARTAQAMTDFGLEARHLRSFRASADREVGLLAQIVTPVSRQRDPDSRARAEELVRELAVLSVRLHALLVKIGLRGVIGS